MGIDKEKIAKRISDVQSAFNSLDKYAGINEAEFLNDDEKVAAAKYFLISMIEGCISLCTHISAKELHKVPDTYTTCFKILADNNIISDDLATSLARMAGFRNLLIHRYWEIDDKKVCQYIKSEKNFLFRKQVESFIKTYFKRLWGLEENKLLRHWGSSLQTKLK